MKILTAHPGPGHGLRAGPLLAGMITAGVGAAAGFVSWQHLNHLGHTVGATGEGAFLTPVTIDGMILVGTLELRQARKEDRPAKPWAYGAVLIGVVGTIAGNIAASTQSTLTARLYFAAPALAFLISVEVLFGKPLSRNLWEIVRSSRLLSRRGAQVADPAPVRRSEPVPDPQLEIVPAAGEEPTPAEAPESPGEPPTPLAVASVPARPPTPASGDGRPPAGRVPARRPQPRRPEKVKQPEKITGSKTRPARMIDGEIVEGDALKRHAYDLIKQKMAERMMAGMSAGAARIGLGAWVARQYDPQMSDRWGQERVAELADWTPYADPHPERYAARVTLDPQPVIEDAELVTG